MGAQVYQKQINRHTLRELVPVESYDEATGLFTTSDNYLGFGFVSRPLPGCDSSVTQCLNVLLTFDYPKESFIQVMLMGSQDIDRTLDNIKSLRKTKDAALNNSIHNRLAMLKGGSCESLSRHAPALIREFRLVITIKVPLEKKGVPSEKDVAGAKDLKISVEQTLKAVGLQPRVLDAEGFLRVVGQVLHWGTDANWRFKTPYYDPDTPLNEQLSEPDDMMQIESNGIWLGDKRLRILSPVRLPGRMRLDQMRTLIGDTMTGVRGVHGNFFINCNVFIPDNAVEREKADNERNATNYQAFGPMMKFNPKLSLKKESTDILFTAINDGGRIVKVKLCVGLFSDSLEQGESRLTEAKTYFSENTWQFKEDKYLALPMLVNCLPLSADPKAVPFLQRYKRLASQHAVEFLPIISDWAGTGTPQLTFISRSGQIMNMDIFDSNTNYNTCIVAASGSGKSFLTNDIITSYISSGAKAWVIDIGRSYEKLVHALDGDFVEFGEKSQICLNPFQIIKNYNEEADMLVGIIASMASVDDKLSDLQNSKMRTLIKGLWDIHGTALLVDTVAQRFLEDEDTRVKDIGHQLFAFTSAGEYGRYFNGDNNINFRNNLTCLELEELKGRTHLQQVVLLILIYQIQQEMYLGDRDQRKILIIDEAWDLLAKGNIAKFIETGYRRFRKYNGAAITITQSLNDLYSSASGVAIAENSANLFLLFQKPETLESIKEQKRLMIGESGHHFLKSVHTITGEYSEIFFVTSYGMGVGRLIVDQYTKLLYSTHPDDIKAISERTKAGMSTAQAIDDILTSTNQRG